MKDHIPKYDGITYIQVKKRIKTDSYSKLRNDTTKQIILTTEHLNKLSYWRLIEKDTWIFWYADVNSAKDFDEKSGFWIYYKWMRCSDGTKWPENLLIKHYYKKELLARYDIPCALIGTFSEVFGKFTQLNVIPTDSV